MFERRKIAERLKAHAEIYLIAAALYSGEEIAADFEQLAQNCRDLAQRFKQGHPKSMPH